MAETTSLTLDEVEVVRMAPSEDVTFYCVDPNPCDPVHTCCDCNPSDPCF
jgi:hypothetical protein